MGVDIEVFYCLDVCMASEKSMDIVVRFDFQELRNAVDQAKREATNRYDLKDSKVEIDLSEEMISVNVENEHQIESVFGILVQKMVARGVSAKVLDRGNIQEIGGMRVKQEMKLRKALDQESAKKIVKLIRENFPKLKANIQGDTVRVISKSIDELQAVIAMLNQDSNLDLPLEFTNYR